MIAVFEDENHRMVVLRCTSRTVHPETLKRLSAAGYKPIMQFNGFNTTSVILADTYRIFKYKEWMKWEKSIKKEKKHEDLQKSL